MIRHDIKIIACHEEIKKCFIGKVTCPHCKKEIKASAEFNFIFEPTLDVAMEYYYSRPEDLGSEEDMCETVLKDVLSHAWDAFNFSDISELDVRFLDPNVDYGSDEYEAKNVVSSRNLNNRDYILDTRLPKIYISLRGWNQAVFSPF
ncbi:hypothetical protein ACFLQ0_05630 [Nitrospinota bacterium]